MKSNVKILDCPVAAISMEETIGIVKESVDNNFQIHHSVVNVGKLVKMKRDRELFESVTSADLINADGMPIVWLSKILGKPLSERVSGIDLMENLVEESSKHGWRIFFLGAKEDIVKKVVDIYSKKYTPSIIAGYKNGYFTEKDESKIAEDIDRSGANILFVAITSPKKENFLYRNRERLSNLNFVMGVGGSFDVVAGKVKRAPLWMQKSGLEWLFRVIQEPRRMFMRYFTTNILFLFDAMEEIIKVRFLGK